MKAILIIDMPEVCGVCPLCQPDNERNMCYCGKSMTDIKLAEKPDWCPLKPTPEKYIEHDITIETERDAAVCSHGITLGHNDVIEELEKPETESDLSTDEGWWKDYELYEMQND